MPGPEITLASFVLRAANPRIMGRDRSPPPPSSPNRPH
jgi:hypothetical protein